MKKYIQIYTALLLLVSILSCQAQKKTEPSKEIKGQSKKIESFLPEVDPYFAETVSKSIASSYGPNSITRNIIQDSKGNYWFATWEGIIHYNGKIFTNFTNKEGLRRYRVFTILEDKAGNIWFGTVGAGLYRYDGKSFTNFTTNDGLINDRIGCITEVENGDIWIGTTDGVSKYNGNSFTNFTTKAGLTSNDVNSIVEDKSGKLWFGTRGNACFYDGKIFTKLTNDEGQPFVNVRSILEDKKGNIWLGGNDGLWRYDGSAYTNLTKNFVGYIYEDKEESIWTSSATSTNGNSKEWVLSQYDLESLKGEDMIPKQIKTVEGMIFGITEDKEGSIWFGTLDGVYRYDGMAFSDFKREPLKG